MKGLRLSLRVLQTIETAMLPGSMPQFIVPVLQEVGHHGGPVLQGAVRRLLVALLMEPQLLQLPPGALG